MSIPGLLNPDPVNPGSNNPDPVSPKAQIGDKPESSNTNYCGAGNQGAYSTNLSAYIGIAICLFIILYFGQDILSTITGNLNPVIHTGGCGNINIFPETHTGGCGGTGLLPERPAGGCGSSNILPEKHTGCGGSFYPFDTVIACGDIYPKFISHLNSLIQLAYSCASLNLLFNIILV